jgi:hypothetical protein
MRVEEEEDVCQRGLNGKLGVQLLPGVGICVKDQDEQRWLVLCDWC